MLISTCMCNPLLLAAQILFLSKRRHDCMLLYCYLTLLHMPIACNQHLFHRMEAILASVTGGILAIPATSRVCMAS